MEDTELLNEYRDSGSGAAFAEIVGRHLNLVYSVALRQTGGDQGLASDVSQEVFIALARDAGKLD